MDVMPPRTAINIYFVHKPMVSTHWKTYNLDDLAAVIVDCGFLSLVTYIKCFQGHSLIQFIVLVAGILS